MYKTCQKLGTGEILTTPTGSHGLEINIFLNIAEVVGLMELQALLLIELTLLETELGLT